MLISFLLLLGVLPFSLAQYDYGSPSESSSSSSSSSSAKSTASATSGASSSTQTVSVGENGLTFSPNSLTASVGQKIVFQFYPGDHSVTEGSFGSPCKPSSGGFYSGFINSNSGPATNAFTLTVNSTDPIYFYCAQEGHCTAGMVGVINAPSTGQTIDAYVAAAKAASGSAPPTTVQGGVVGPPSSGGSSSGSSTSSAASSSSTAKSDGYSLAESTRQNVLLALGVALFAFLN